MGELDLGDLLELPPLAPTTGGSSPSPQPSPEVPELDLSDLEGLDLGAALGLTPASSPAAGVGGTASLLGDRASAGVGQPEQQAKETEKLNEDRASVGGRQPEPSAPAALAAGIEVLELPGELDLEMPRPEAGITGLMDLAPLAEPLPVTGAGASTGPGPSAGDAAAAASVQSGQPGADLGQGLELDLSDLLNLDLDLSVLSAPEAAVPPAPTAAAFTAESADANITSLSAIPADTPTSAPAPATTEDETRLVLDFDQEPESWDEVGIKLDLARAYLQMDDPEAARALLVEILTEGTEEQIAQAKTLLARLE